MQTLRRTAALQIQLLELVVQEKDVGELVDRVASILEVPIVLFDTQGRVVCASGRASDDADARPRSVGGLRAPARPTGSARRGGRGGRPHLLPRGPHHGPRGARARGSRLAAAAERLRRRVPALPAAARHARAAAQARRAEDAAPRAPRPAARHPRRPQPRAGPAHPPGGAGVQRDERPAPGGRGAGRAASLVRAEPSPARPRTSPPAACCARSTPGSASAASRS